MRLSVKPPVTDTHERETPPGGGGNEVQPAPPLPPRGRDEDELDLHELLAPGCLPF